MTSARRLGRPKKPKLYERPLVEAEHPLVDLLTVLKRRREKYEGDLKKWAQLAEALRRMPVASPKRFAQRARELQDRLALIDDDVAEVEGGIADAAGSVTVEREIYTAMNQKYAVGAWGHAIGRQTGRSKLSSEAARDAYRSRRRRLARLERRAPPDLGDLDPPSVVADFIARGVAEVSLMQETKGAERRAVIKERDSLVRDLLHLGVDPSILPRPVSRVGRPRRST